MKTQVMLGVIATALLSSPAFAVKEGGGGHFVYNSDGSVTIADHYYQNTTIVPTPIPHSLELAVEIKARGLGAVGLSKIKGGSDRFEYLFGKAIYYFVDVIPEVADCNLKVNLTLPSGSTLDLAACTSGNHTFIKTSDWDTAPTPVKLDLLIHERLREISGPNSQVIEGEIMTLVNASDLIDAIHTKEQAKSFVNLSLKETQLLEAARVAAVGIVFQGHAPQSCELDSNPEVNTHDCYADTVNYGVTPNGGGILLRNQLSWMPENAYVGIGSILVGPGTIGENDRIVNSGVFTNYWLKDNVNLNNASVEGASIFEKNTSIKDAFVIGSNGHHTISSSDPNWSDESVDVSGSLDGMGQVTLCYLNIEGKSQDSSKGFDFDLASDCRPNR